jgi:hypothetical protein
MAGYKLTQEVWLEANAHRLPALLTNISTLILLTISILGREIRWVVEEQKKGKKKKNKGKLYTFVTETPVASEVRQSEYPVKVSEVMT